MKRRGRWIGISVLLFAATFFSGPIAAEDDAGIVDWTQWRGPTRDSRLPNTDWPETLGDGLVQKWRVPLGPGYSGPIVVGERVFVTETEAETSEVVIALDRATGKEVWRQSWKGAMKVPFFASSNGSWIRSTPAYSAGRLYVGGMRDVLVCLDADTGEIVWRLDFVEKLQSALPAFGFVCSPLVVGDDVYVQAGGAVLKLKAASGEIVWRSLADGGGMNGSAFSSPILTTLGGREQLIVQTRTELAGVDPANGEELWSEEIPAFRGMNILTPLRLADRIFTSSYGGKSFLFDVVARKEGGFELNEAWTNKAQGYMSSPVWIDGHVYLHLRNQRFVCLDAASGKEAWTTEPFGRYWSMISQGDMIMSLDERGELLLIRADPREFKLLDRKVVSDEECWAHLAIRGREIFVRDLKGLTVWNWNP